MLSARDRYRFEPRVDPKRTQQVADVIAHRLRAELQLLRDLLRGTTALEQAQNLGLTRREMRRQKLVGLLLDIRQLTEDADQAVSPHQRARADVDLDAAAVAVYEDD
jgi:hypothetical protein